MKKRLACAGASLLIAASPAWGWTMFYDGFAYEPFSDGSPAYVLGTQIGYELGDPVRHSQANGWTSTYASSAWTAANNGTAWGVPGSGVSGYWPFIINFNLNPPSPMAAGTGHAVESFGSASNNGKVARCSPINLNQIPPTGPFRTITRGTVYYSMMVWVIESVTLTTPGNGGFHAGFNNSDPVACTGTSGCAMTTAGARLMLRKAAGDGTNHAFQVGIQNEAASPIAWDPTSYPAGNDPLTALFVVASYQFNQATNTDDVVSLWVNPSSATFGNAAPPSTTVTTTGADLPELRIKSFFIRHTGTSGGTVARVAFDELRIGTSWADVTSDVACTAPSVTCISLPGSPAGASPTGVSITGANFVQGVTQVKLKMTGQPDIDGNNVDVSDPQHLVCNFSIPGAAVLGKRNVQVTTCTDSPATLADAFEVTCGNSHADFNCDTFVDGNDVVQFETCAPIGVHGAAVPLTPGCEGKDLDGNGSVDLGDWAIVQRCYAGSSVPANPDCESACAP